VNFRVHSGPALGAFNAAVRGTPLANWRGRRVADVAALIMTDAAATLDRARKRIGGWDIDPR
jgi:trans-AT polyketide synthase/acyltransferase/oxidoreductase domain-containing protein